jgi:tRNA pseudouridine32 synthase / 23S rRNA pseudouridine746 synthase
MLGFECLYLDKDLIVCNKPAGLLTVPGRGDDKKDCLSARVQAQHADALVVHRLDMATSGLVLFARGLEAQRALNHQFEQRQIDKRYTAVVAGHLPQDQGEICLPLIADWPQRPRQKVDHDHGRFALTHFTVLHRDEGSQSTRVALVPVTGRSHQLRVHLLALGHPILGDALYAPPEVVCLSARLLLHATTLALKHPGSGLPLRFDSAASF